MYPLLISLLLVLGSVIGCQDTSNVNVIAPSSGSTVPSPVRILANAISAGHTISSTMVLVDGSPSGALINGGGVDVSFQLSNGSHTVTLRSTDDAGTVLTGQTTFTVSGTMTPPPTGSVPPFNHVYVVVEENHSYSSVIGSSSMPYFNSLAQQYGLAVNYYSNSHPSIGNYLMMTSGQVVTNDDGYNGTINVDNIVRQLNAAGKTWRAYAQGLPSVGYVGGNTGAYVRRHNPLSFYSDVVNDANQRNNLVPMTQWTTDMNSGATANYSFLVPDVNDDAHDGTLQEADDWLKNNIAPLIASSQFQNDGLLMITFDESSTLDSTYGGGHIATVIISSKAKKGYRGTGLYQHQNLLSTSCAALGLKNCPGAAFISGDMSEFF